jgi:hypothetical protein
VAVRYFLAERSIQNYQQQDCCLVVEVRGHEWIDDELIRLAAEEAIDQEFGQRLTLWLADEDEATQYLQAHPDATRGSLTLGSGVPLFWHLLRIG